MIQLGSPPLGDGLALLDNTERFGPGVLTDEFMIAADSKSLSVVVVGGGLAGLSSACVLAARGHRVTLLDKNDWLGGKAAIHKAEGFRFDMGPTILTLPSVLKRVFEEADRKMEDYLEILPLDPQWRCFFESDGNGGPMDASVLDLVADTDAMKHHLSEFTSGEASVEGYERFIRLSEQLHGVSDRFFFWKSIGGLKDTMDMGAFSIAVLKDVLSLRMGQSVASVVRSHVPDARVAQMMDHFTQYVGSSPYASPAVLCGIAHMQTQEGIWYPLGGTRAVPEALSRFSRRTGCRVSYGNGRRTHSNQRETCYRRDHRFGRDVAVRRCCQ